MRSGKHHDFGHPYDALELGDASRRFIKIANIVRAMAEERNESVGALAQALSDNAERIFGSFAAGSTL